MNGSRFNYEDYAYEPVADPQESYFLSVRSETRPEPAVTFVATPPESVLSKPVGELIADSVLSKPVGELLGRKRRLAS